MKAKKINKKRVFVAMSGGVDSSVAAWLLKKQGYEVIGVTMRFNIPGSHKGHGIEDARGVARKLGIPHYVFNFGKVLESKIINNFCSEYLKGRTPNPCVRCNQLIKFDTLLKKARSMDAQFLATGHYARIVYSRKLNRYIVKKGKDARKDQSYFLYRINKRVLPQVLMPLGNYTKQQIRIMAKNIGIKVAKKPASQEICFIKKDYRDFLKSRLSKMNTDIKPGSVADIQGKVLGRHRGICFYTIGQRKGLGLARPEPWYVLEKDIENNILVVGPVEQLGGQQAVVADLNWISGEHPPMPYDVEVKIRYQAPAAPAQLELGSDGTVLVHFEQMMRDITPGQLAVFYDGDLVIGSGTIVI